MNFTPSPYSTTSTKNYWCHFCQRVFNKIFIEDTEIQCIICRGNICEEITSHSPSPSRFIPFNMNSSEEDNDNEDQESLIELIMNLIRNDYEEDEIESIINYLMQNDPNRYGTPPASKKAVASLKNIELTKDQQVAFGSENMCSVCKDELEVKQNVIKLPCSHFYHTDCIIPWLKEHNSCPICRDELETDDKDYEKAKMELLKRMHNANH